MTKKQTRTSWILGISTFVAVVILIVSLRANDWFWVSFSLPAAILSFRKYDRLTKNGIEDGD